MCGKKAREVELVHRPEDADGREEDHPAPVGGDQAVGAPERFGPVLLPRDVEPAAERLRHLHRGEAGARRLAGDRREREAREPGRVDEAGEVGVVEEERVLAVEVEPAGERVRRRAVEDAAVRLERAGRAGRAEPDRLAPERELRPGPGPARRPAGRATAGRTRPLRSVRRTSGSARASSPTRARRRSSSGPSSVASPSRTDRDPPLRRREAAAVRLPRARPRGGRRRAAAGRSRPSRRARSHGARRRGRRPGRTGRGRGRGGRAAGARGRRRRG